MAAKILLFIWLSCVLTPLLSCQSFETVNTPSGQIKGVVVPTPGGDVVQFRNIPFAEPPIGDLRLKKPQPVKPWTGTLDGTKVGPSCLQDMYLMAELNKFMDNQDMSEDCLYLTVYAPQSEPSNEKKKAVMVWFHGGGFVFGTGNSYDGSFLALKDVIVVTVNYRLGIFGFLSTGDSALPGNYGLWDQIEALKWVQKNIAAFGGDAQRVTIFGESAGGFSVSFLALIPDNEGLFQRVICQSGTANAFMSVSQKPLKLAEKVGRNLKCITENDSHTDTGALVKCLKSKSGDDLLKGQGDPMKLFMERDFSFLLDYWPVIDNELIIRHPMDSLKDKTSAESRFFRSLDVVAGTTNDEGSSTHMFFGRYQEAMNFNVTDGIPSSVLCKVFAPVVAREMFDDDTIVPDMICEKYSVENITKQSTIVCNLHADIFFVSPTVEFLKYHVADNNAKETYQYLFSQPLEFQIFMPKPVWSEGADHGADLVYEFGPGYIHDMHESLSSDEAMAFSDIFVTYWTNFAKTGNPNGDRLVPWNPYSLTEKEYLELKFEPVLRKDLYSDRMKFLQEDIPNKLLRATKTEL